MTEQLILETISRCLKDWKGIRNNQHGLTKEKLINFWDEMTGLVAEGRAVDAVYQNCSKTFDTVFRMILMKYGLDERTNSWAQKVMAQSTSRPITGDVPQGSIRSPVLFITLISDLNDQAKHSVWAKFAEGTKLSGAADAAEGCATIHTDPDRLEKWADGSLMKLQLPT